jgi:hypothetical protein
MDLTVCADELKKWGWRDAGNSQDSCDFDASWKIGEGLDELGLSDKPKEDGGDNECFRVEHGDEMRKDDKGDRIPILKQTYTVGEGNNKKRYSVRELSSRKRPSVSP